MSLTRAITNAQTGLQVNALRADLVASNISNATTPGYVRRSVLLGESILAGRGAGVNARGIVRSEDLRLLAEQRDLGASLARSTVLTNAYQSLSAQLGTADTGFGLFQAFAGFETSLQNFSQAPESSANQFSVLDNGREIIDTLGKLYEAARDLRAQSDQAINDGVQVVNQALQDLQSLNRQITALNGSSSDASALLDERNRVVDVIAEYMPVVTVPRDSGAIDLMTPEGVFLYAGQPRTLSFTPGNDFDGSASLTGGQLSGLFVDGQEITPGIQSYAALRSGSFAGLFEVRDTEMPNFMTQLDIIAVDLVERFSDDSIDPTKTPGAQGLFTVSGPLTDPGIASRLYLNAAIDPDAGGAVWRLRDGIGATTPGPAGQSAIANNLLNAFTSARNTNLGGGLAGLFSATELVAGFSSQVGQARIRFESIQSSNTAQYTLASDLVLTRTGVDTDKEMQDLLLIEQAYAANARVIQVANDMMQILLEL